VFYFLLLWLFIFCGDGYAESNHTLPTLSEKDLSHYMKNQLQNLDENIYLYSSLSSISLDKALTEFHISDGLNAHLIPLTTIKKYPPINIEVRSEYFDVTIWGQIENHFNQNIEVIEIENEILATLKELEGINKKHTELFGRKAPRFNLGNTVTINKYNYFSDKKESKKNKDKRNIKRSDKNKNGQESILKNREATLKQSEFRLRKELVKNRLERHERSLKMLDPGITLEPKMALNTDQIKRRSNFSERSGWIDIMFDKINQTVLFFLKNPFVFFFVVVLFILFFMFLGVLFKRR
jgi:hypothetical protein